MKHFLSLQPDSFICEIAEKRGELGTLDIDITPDVESYTKAVQLLRENIRDNRFTGVSKLTQAFRYHYYDITRRILKEERQVLPCYAGVASAHIAPDGDIWVCCIKGEPIGNLRDTDYDLRKIWFSKKAARVRDSIKKGECYCPLANASYTNMLFNMKSLAQVSYNYIALFSKRR